MGALASVPVPAAVAFASVAVLASVEAVAPVGVLPPVAARAGNSSRPHDRASMRAFECRIGTLLLMPYHGPPREAAGGCRRTCSRRWRRVPEISEAHTITLRRGRLNVESGRYHRCPNRGPSQEVPGNVPLQEIVRRTELGSKEPFSRWRSASEDRSPGGARLQEMVRPMAEAITDIRSIISANWSG